MNNTSLLLLRPLLLAVLVGSASLKAHERISRRDYAQHREEVDAARKKAFRVSYLKEKYSSEMAMLKGENGEFDKPGTVVAALSIAEGDYRMGRTGRPVFHFEDFDGVLYYTAHGPESRCGICEAAKGVPE